MVVQIQLAIYHILITSCLIRKGSPFHHLILSFCADRKKVYKERTAAQVLPSLAPHRAGGAVKSLRSDTAVSRLPDTAQPTYVGTARP